MIQNNFVIEQLTFPRVAEAANVSDNSWRKLFEEKELNYPSEQIYLRAFKQEQTLEVWVSDVVQYKLIKTYNFTAATGIAGPKNKEGDLQIPEGFYQIDTFNANSKFHLSFRINYPNFADSVRNKAAKNLGGDIYIHGGNQTVGCIPIGDDNIAELYWLCVKSFDKNPVIPVHIFPCKMEEKSINELNKQFPTQVLFWKSLQPMYSFFQSHRMIGEVSGCDASGNYQLSIPWD